MSSFLMHFIDKIVILLLSIFRTSNIISLVKLKWCPVSFAERQKIIPHDKDGSVN